MTGQDKNGHSSAIPEVRRGRRLESARRGLGLTQEEMAATIGVSIKTYQRYEAGTQELKAAHMAALRDLSVDINWLVSGEGEMLAGSIPVKNEASPADGFVLVPRYDIEASAGHGALIAEENVLDHMAFREDWIRRALRVDPRRLALITAAGDSMEPVIRSGDLLLVDMSVQRIVDDTIYIVEVSGNLLVKRIQQFLGGVIVKSENPSYEPWTLRGDEVAELQVRGRIRWIGRLI